MVERLLLLLLSPRLQMSQQYKHPIKKINNFGAAFSSWLRALLSSAGLILSTGLPLTISSDLRDTEDLQKVPSQPLVIVDFSCQLGTNLESAGKKEPHLKNCSGQISLGHVHGSFSKLIIDVERPGPLGSTIPRQVRPDHVRKVTEQATRSQTISSILPWSLLQFPSASSCP